MMKRIFLATILVLLTAGIFILRGPEKEITEEKKPAEKKAKVAIVIDDLGYNAANIDSIFDINKPVTLSVLPNLPYSRTIASGAAERGYEVILHLPLESFQDEAPAEEATISAGMEDKEVVSSLTRAIDSVNTLKGVSNHMGSKATQDERLMRVIFGELKKRKLYFFDSLVTDNSVCQRIAKEVGIKFARRDVYLDNLDDKSYIKNQYKLLIGEARDRGYSLGIGHDKELTVQTLAEEMPKSEKEGIEFVFLSELVK